MKIQTDVLDVLTRSTVDENNNILFLPSEQLDRKLYLDVNKCLESIGGKWNRKLRGHLFDHNPSDDLDEMINTGEWTDEKKEFQFFETPNDLAKRMILFAEIEEGKDGSSILEPSAGKGAIADKFPKDNSVSLVELNPKFVKILRDKGYAVIEGDFLTLDFKADRIIMNPPFTKQQDIKHIFHAWDCLTNGGICVSIVSESPFFRENKLSRDFREWMDKNDIENYKLDEGTFKESGTMVRARIIVGTKNG